MLSDGVRLMNGPGLDDAESLGLWSRLFLRVGINPYHLGPFFILGGGVWLFVTLAVVTGRPWARKAAIVIAFATLWYALPGTALSAIYLITLRTLRPREGDA